jgi:hypothetical protein
MSEEKLKALCELTVLNSEQVAALSKIVGHTVRVLHETGHFANHPEFFQWIAEHANGLEKLEQAAASLKATAQQQQTVLP